MNFFQRRKVFVSMNFEQAAQMRSKIQSGKVECQLVRKNRSHPAGMKHLLNADNQLVEYQLFVHKKDVEIAQFLMNQPLHF